MTEGITASIVVIGDEILLGQVTDTNSGAIARMLDAVDIPVVSTHAVGDDSVSICQGVKAAMSRSRLVITTGGLGPTKDDITKEVLMRIFGGELVHDPEVAENVARIFERRGLQLNDLTRGQAMVPSSCRVIQNTFGTAPVMWFDRDDHVLVSLPGVPFECVGMMRQCVLNEICRRFMPDTVIYHHTLIVSGVTESDLAERLAPWEQDLPPGVHLAYLPQPGYIRLRLDGRYVDEEYFNYMVDGLRRMIKPYILYDGDATPAAILLSLLSERGLTFATAESCTGGNIAHCITEVPGSSASFLGSVVSYSNEVKTNVLGVSQSDLDTYGAVSLQVVRQMAEGVARLTGADCSVATSGIAGPGGGTPDKPVGTVWMAVHTPKETVSFCKRFPGDRSRVIERATTEVLLALARSLREDGR